MNRRGLLGAILAAGVAPAFAGSSVLMPARPLVHVPVHHDRYLTVATGFAIAEPIEVRLNGLILPPRSYTVHDYGQGMLQVTLVANEFRLNDRLMIRPAGCANGARIEVVCP